jgi:hypothetical protein
MQFLVSFQPGAAGGSGSRKGKQASQVGAEKEAAVEVGLATVSEEEWPEEEEDLEDGLPERQPPAATQKKRHRLMKLSDSRQQRGLARVKKPLQMQQAAVGCQTGLVRSHPSLGSRDS